MSAASSISKRFLLISASSTSNDPRRRGIPIAQRVDRAQDGFLDHAAEHQDLFLDVLELAMERSAIPADLDW